ncbi:MAG: hypothetical protein NUK65_12625, partial [Firmicutes bacterium]|nr:hypothetical protein [Bacillota bacterium]
TGTSLLARLNDYMRQLVSKGVDYDRLRQQILFTPSCGAGTLTSEETDAVYGVLQQLGERYQLECKT